MSSSNNSSSTTGAAATTAADSGTKSTDGMTDAQRRLFNIRMKINQGRKANKSEVEDEYQRFNDPKYEQKQVKQRYLEKLKDEAADSNIKSKSGNTDEIKLDPMLQQTAEQAEFEKEKRERKQENISTFGWQAFTVEATHKAYEKRLKKLPTSSSGSINSSASTGGASTSVTSAMTGSTIAPLDYGAKGAHVSKSALDRLSQDVSDRKEAVQKNSRRRKAVEGEDVDYINDRNAAFNKKIKRSFDKYTVEIRQNLERGTAV